MTRTMRTKAVGQAIVLSALLGSVAWVTVNLGRGFRLWQHGTGHTETVICVLPKRMWGYGTTPMILTHGNGTTFNGGSLTRYGCFGVATFDLRYFGFNPWTGNASYACG